MASETNNKLDISNLDERSKELELLYQIDEIINNEDIETLDTLRHLVEIIPQGWRFPDICKVQILLNDFEVYSDGLVKTDLKQSSSIYIDDKKAGEINVYYIKPIRSEKGIFLPGERRLLNNIADKLSKYMVFKKLRQSIEELKKQAPGSQEDTFKSEPADPVKDWLTKFNLSDEDIQQILKVKLQFRKGEIICKQGAITSYIMLLTDGLTKNYLEGTQERGFNFKIVKPLDFIGLSSLFGSNVYHFSGAAITPATIYHIETSVFKDIIKRNDAFAEEIMKWYCRITESHLERLSCLANKQSLGRIADILLYLTEEVFDGPMIGNVISRKDIAELAGMSTESAVRILSELKKDKIIKVLNKGIEVVNFKMLRTYSIAG